MVWEAIRVSKDSRVDPPSSLSSVILTKVWFLGTISSEMSASPFFSDSESCNNLQNCLVNIYKISRMFQFPACPCKVVSTQLVKKWVSHWKRTPTWVLSDWTRTSISINFIAWVLILEIVNEMQKVWAPTQHPTYKDIRTITPTSVDILSENWDLLETPILTVQVAMFV